MTVMEYAKARHIGDILKERNIEIIGADPVTRHGFTQVPNFILTKKELSVGAKLAYAMLLKYAWDNNARSASQAMEIWLSCCRWGLGSCRVGTRREALYAGEAAFRWRGSSGGCGISDHVARGQDAMSVSRLCDTVAGAFSSACRY